jgi:hypothetical protein
MFCSEDCRFIVENFYTNDLSIAIIKSDEARTEEFLTSFFHSVSAKMHEDACLAAGGDLNLIEEYHQDLNLKTIFDFDFNNQSETEKKKKQLKCLFGLKGHKLHPREKLFANCLAMNAFLNLISLYSVDNSTTFSNYEAFTVCLFGSLFNHSCDPDVHTFSLNNKIVFYVAKPVKAGEQLFICYK